METVERHVLRVRKGRPASWNMRWQYEAGDVRPESETLSARVTWGGENLPLTVGSGIAMTPGDADAFTLDLTLDQVRNLPTGPVARLIITSTPPAGAPVDHPAIVLDAYYA